MRPLSLLLALGLTACGGAADVARDQASPFAVDPKLRALSSGTAAERFFPLVHGNVYQYEVQSADGSRGLMVARSRRQDATHGELHTPAGVRSFEYRADGVVLSSHPGGPQYVLKQPIVVGNRWRGEHQGWVEIRAVGGRVPVPAGRFDDCVQTIEERGGDVPLSITTWLCPGTGIVLVEGSSGTKRERIALASYGPPVDIGPDGLRVLH